MDWEKPRVSIPATIATKAVPRSYIQARLLSGSSSTTTGSVHIRAPLTNDDDDQDDEDDGDQDDEDDGSDFESSGSKSKWSSRNSVIDSGTDEGFESASADTDEETAEENAVLGGIRVYRPIRGDPVDETGEGSAFSVRSKVYRSSVGELDKETSVNYSSFGEEDSESGSEVDRVSPKARIVIPRARLSLDDDEVDQVLDSEDEDNGLSSVFGSPNTRTVARVKCPVIAGEEEEEEEIEDKSSEVGESNLVDNLEFSGSVLGEFASGGVDAVGMNHSDAGSVSFETFEERSLNLAPGNFVNVGTELDITFKQLIEQRASQGNSFEETNHVADSSIHELGALMIPDEGSIGSGSGESGGEDIGNMRGEAGKFQGNDCGVFSELEEIPECRSELGSGMWNSGTFRMNPKVESESESEVKQDLKGTDRNLVLPDEDVSSSSFRNPVEMADKIVENEQISQRINSKFVLENDGQPNQISLKAEYSFLLCDKDEIAASGSSTVTSNGKENEEEMARLIHDHTFTELDEYQVTSRRREELSDYNSGCSSEESSSKHFTEHLGEEEEKERFAKIQLIRSKLLRVIRTLGLATGDEIATEVLAKLALASGKRKIVHGFHTEPEEMKTMHHKGEVPDDDDFSVNVLVLGKTGVGKSATVNSIIGETKSPVGAFGVTTKSTLDIFGNVGGIRVRFLDTPGLRSSAAEDRFNRKVLMSIKKHMRQFPIDIVLFIDRLDQQSGNTGDIQLLKSITSSLGSSIWKNAIVVLTHAASVVPDSSYSDLVAQRSFLLQKLISHVVPELSCADLSMMPRVVLVENNQNSLPENETGECMFLSWRQQLLLLCFSAKIMSEASSLQNQETLQEKSNLFNSSLHSFSFFHSLWNLLLYRAHSRLVSHSCNELELNKACFSDSWAEKLSEEQKKVYFDEHRFLEKKQLETMKMSCEANSRGFKERRNLGIQAKGCGKGFVVCFDTFNVKTEIPIGKGSRTFFSVGGDEREGQILLKMRGLEQMQIVAFGVLPLIISLFRRVYGENTQKNSK